jgi:hypothetical protein
VRTVKMFLIPALALALSGPAWAAGENSKATKELSSFGALRTLAPDTAKAQALDWLKAVKGDGQALQAFEAIWKDPDRMVLDQVADTLALGDPEAAKLLTDARDATSPAPTKVPAILKDSKRPLFFRANLALAYAKALTGRRVYEESLAALKTCKVEQVVDPGSYLFYRSVAEYTLQLRADANYSILRLLDDVVDTPDRYKNVAALMVYDMVSWKDKDLGWISRTAGNIERRLDLSRGGQVTQKMEKDVINRLDEMIKKLENEKDGS